MVATHIAAVGTSEFTLGFTLVGVTNIVETDLLDAKKRLEAIRSAMQNEESGIIIIEEEVFEGIPLAERILLENSVRPVVIALRRERGESGTLRRQVIRAIGVDLLAGDTRSDKDPYTKNHANIRQEIS
jgi:vacuolar-type H+-ATPase subunit F/Vma7